MARAIRVASLVLWAATLALASFAASAQRVEGDRAGATGLYASEVQVNGQGEAERRNAFSRGLAQVLGKISGDRDVASQPGVGQEVRRAADYVSGYDYRQDEGLSASGAPSFRTTLVIRYDQEQVDNLVAMLGVPVWPQPRPKPVLWLAIDDGRGPRLVGSGQSAAARSALDRAVERGFRLGLPSGSAAEQAVVGAIWRGDTAAVARASQPYSPPMQLIGKLYREAGGWTADWIFVDEGRVLSRWSDSGADARRVMATGAEGAADALTERYAKRESAGPPGRYRVTFTGIDSSSDFMRLSGYLQGLAVVRDVVPLRATADALELELDLLSGLPGFARSVQADGVLVGEGVAAGAATADAPQNTSIAVPTAYRLR
ncbi:MAG: DUF2066 domain-containing protein [Pseudomonadota bacterium]|nr:DUF2066 domain-containing protein [Pseudomonadota bacterium]